MLPNPYKCKIEGRFESRLYEIQSPVTGCKWPRHCSLHHWRSSFLSDAWFYLELETVHRLRPIESASRGKPRKESRGEGEETAYVPGNRSSAMTRSIIDDHTPRALRTNTLSCQSFSTPIRLLIHWICSTPVHCSTCSYSLSIETVAVNGIAF